VRDETARFARAGEVADEVRFCDAIDSTVSRPIVVAAPFASGSSVRKRFRGRISSTGVRYLRPFVDNVDELETLPPLMTNTRYGATNAHQQK
jgi:hypothetical protein